jgi:hypothetical protein
MNLLTKTLVPDRVVVRDAKNDLLSRMSKI